MHLVIITFLGFLFAFVFSINLKNKSKIKDIIFAFNLIINKKKFFDLGKILSPIITYNTAIDLDSIQDLFLNIDILSKIILNKTIFYFLANIQLIKFYLLFDKINCSIFAKAIWYSIFTIFNSSNWTGELFIMYARYVD